jgi:hypothetical protein
MSEEWSARLGLPLLQPGQAQKEMDHNEALALLDIAVQPAAIAIGVSSPPTAPQEGQCWIVGDDATGAWAGREGAIAGWTAGGWRFIAPRDGVTAWSIADDTIATYRGGNWTVGTVFARRLEVGGETVVGARQPAIAAPSGGVAPDDEARTAVTEILQSLRAHGLIAS